MKTSYAKRRAKGRNNLARILGITGPAISQWGEDVPAGREVQIRELRPEWFRRSGASQSARSGGAAV